MVAIALTIAGSDPSGGAGIQADLNAFSALGVYGMSVITAVTAQNTQGVAGVFDLSETALAAQIDAVMSDVTPGAVKVGMLSNSGNVRTVGAKLREYDMRHVVLDPVMAATSGAPLLDPEARDVLRRELLPLVFLVTPNLDEAEALQEGPVRSLSQMETAARRIHASGAAHVLIKGGHLEDDPAVDVFFDGRRIEFISGDRIDAPEAHGTGCVLSAAITALLARGRRLPDAVREGKAFTRRAIENAIRLGGGRACCDPLSLLRKG